MLQNSSNMRILSLLGAVLLRQDGVAVMIFSFINLDQKYITLTVLCSLSSIALHFFLYILGTTSLLRKIVWSTQLILALMFTLARIVWLGAGVSWKAVEKFLTTQYYPQKLWSHHSPSSQAAQDFSQGSFQNVLRSWWLTSPRATTNSFCP